MLLTPGPYNETYFEHAYLARYLGYTLVEGGDLTVRDNRVFLKVLGGLQPVDVIFRRLDDDFCDPLELRPDSFLGVPGLVQAVRSGNVAVANALGTGLLETPALLAFLPRLCRDLLGEDLRLRIGPDVVVRRPGRRCGTSSTTSPTWSSSRRSRPRRLEPIFAGELSARAAAARWPTASGPGRATTSRQARLDLSTAPVLDGDRLVPAEAGAAVVPGGRPATGSRSCPAG